MTGQQEALSNEETKLTDILRQGLELEIFTASESIYLYEIISKNSAVLTEKHYGDLFGSLQACLARQLILSIVKIYEPPNNRHPIRSLPTALELIQENRNTLKIHYRDELEHKLLKLGCDQDTLKNLCEPQLTEKVVQMLKHQCPSKEALDALKSQRDKRIAHNEAINETKLRQVCWGEPEDLLEKAKMMMGILGNHYLGLIYEENGDYHQSYDARKAARSLSRLFNEAGISLDHYSSDIQ